MLSNLKVGDDDPKKYKHIIVDEFQDLTEGEQELFARLLEPGGSFVALGDPQQSIYKFRGNSIDGLKNLETILKIKKGDVQDIVMTECQRCPKEIVEAANALMILGSSTPMVSISTRPANTHVISWSTPQEEIQGMANAIVNKYNSTEKSQRHLVMVTRRQFGFRLREEIRLIDQSIHVNLSFSEGLLETWPVREAFLLFCLLTDPDAATWRAWLGYQTPSADGKVRFKADARNADAYLRLFAETKESLDEEVIDQIAKGSRQLKGKGAKTIIARANRFFQLKSELGKVGDDPEDFVKRSFNFEKWKKEAFAEEVNVVADDMELLQQKTLALLLSQDAKSGDGTEAESSLRKLTQRLRSDIAVRDIFDDEKPFDIQVTTLWSAKGVTADHVYVLGLTDQTIPGTYKDDYPDSEAEFLKEQKRLFYVSLTRSKNTVVLSRSKKIKRSEAQRLGFTDLPGQGHWVTLDMSQYLRIIIKQLPDIVTGSTWSGC